MTQVKGDAEDVGAVCREVAMTCILSLAEMPLCGGKKRKACIKRDWYWKAVE
mgnify:CR=1 FL=1